MGHRGASPQSRNFVPAQAASSRARANSSAQPSPTPLRAARPQSAAPRRSHLCRTPGQTQHQGQAAPPGPQQQSAQSRLAPVGAAAPSRVQQALLEVQLSFANSHRPTRTNPRVTSPAQAAADPSTHPQHSEAACTGPLTRCHSHSGHLFTCTRQHIPPTGQASQEQAAVHHAPSTARQRGAASQHPSHVDPAWEDAALGANLGRKPLVSLQDRLLHQGSCRTPQLPTPPMKYCPWSSSNPFKQRLLISTCSLISSFAFELTADSTLLLTAPERSTKVLGRSLSSPGDRDTGDRGRQSSPGRQRGGPCLLRPPGEGRTWGLGSDPAGSSPVRAEHGDGQSS